MSRDIFERKHQQIMEHIADPDNSPLPVSMQKQFERITSMSKLLDRYPSQKTVVKLHRAKYPDIGVTTVYHDLRLARKIYNSFYQFDHDFYRTWLINDIMKNIERCREKDTYQYARVLALEHANLLKAIGEKSEELPDPERNEKHSFYIMVNIDNRQVKLDINKLHELPVNTVRELSCALTAGKEISESDASKLMNS